MAARGAGGTARPTDVSLYADVLEPFRRAMHTDPRQHPLHPQPPPAAARLNFSDSERALNNVAAFLTPLGKRKSAGLDGSTTTPFLKRARSTDASNGPDNVSAASPWETNRLRGELIVTKTQISELESRISHQHQLRKEMQLLFDDERSSLVEQHKRDELALQEMEARLNTIRKREADVKDELNQSEHKRREAKQKWDKEKEHLNKQIADLKDKMLEMKSAGEVVTSEMKRDMSELQNGLELAKAEAEMLRRQLTDQTSRAEECTSLRAQLEKQSAELQQKCTQLRQLQYERDSYKDWQQQAKTAQKRLSNMAKLEREVGKLRANERSIRDNICNTLMLEEQVHSLTKQLEALQPSQQELHEAKVKLASLESTLEEWLSVGRARGVERPAELAAALDSAMQREVTSVSDCSNAQSQLAQLTEEASTLKFERDKATTKLTELQAVRKSQESLIHRLQKRLLLVTRERDSYRQQLDCYEKELSVTICGEAGGTSGTALLSQRIEQLERSIQGYNDLLNQVDTQAHTKGMEKLRAEVSRWRDEAEAARRDVTKLRAQRDHFQAQLEKLQVSSTKVLHLAENPAAMAERQLQAELEAAQEEIKRLKAGGGGGGGAEAAALKQQLESSRIKMQRIKEEYTSSAQEYRDVCYMLLGYKIDRTGHKNYRISSMYAESPDEYLTFTLCEDGIEMVHTEYSASLVELVELHLHQHRSIPLFLSALTCELFTHSTMQQDGDVQT